MPKHPEVLDHWHTLVENFSTSSLDFYDLVKQRIAEREIPGLKVKTVEWKESGFGSGKRVYLRVSREDLNFDICAAPFGNGFFFSSWTARIPRVLLDFGFLFSLLLVHGLLVAYFAKLAEGGAPIMSALFVPPLMLALLLLLGLFVRYGDRGSEPTVLSMPITGFVYRFIFRPSTYFNEDTAIMFRTAVQQAVLEAVEAVTKEKGVRLKIEPGSLKPVGVGDESSVAP